MQREGERKRDWETKVNIARERNSEEMLGPIVVSKSIRWILSVLQFVYNRESNEQAKEKEFKQKKDDQNVKLKAFFCVCGDVRECAEESYCIFNCNLLLFPFLLYYSWVYEES